MGNKLKESQKDKREKIPLGDCLGILSWYQSTDTELISQFFTEIRSIWWRGKENYSRTLKKYMEKS